jgi:glycosyltransferase involved in cell wall biosynthesis
MPAFNEEANLAANVPLLMDKLSMLSVDFELLIVDDGSQDDTSRVAGDLVTRVPGDTHVARDAHVARGANAERVSGTEPVLTTGPIVRTGEIRVLQHAQNAGIGRALYTGFQNARGTYTIFIPADLAMDLDDIVKYLDAVQEADVIVGLRSDRRGTSLARRLVSWINIALVRVLFRMPVHQFQYICMWPTRFLQEIAIEYPDSAFLQAEVLIKARDMGYRLAEIEVTYVPRTRGRPTGARTRLVLKSASDLLHFWLRWLFRKRAADGRRNWRVRQVQGA